jgi:hypothetical protein
MKTFLLTLALSSAAFAARYRLEVEMKTGRTVLEKSVVELEAGDSAVFESDTHFYEVTLKEPATGQVKLEFVAGVTDAEGGRSTVAQPSVVARVGQAATVSVGRVENPRETVSLKVTAKLLPVR